MKYARKLKDSYALIMFDTLEQAQKSDACWGNVYAVVAEYREIPVTKTEWVKVWPKEV
jgi:hypothetical protein